MTDFFQITTELPADEVDQEEFYQTMRTMRLLQAAFDPLTMEVLAGVVYPRLMVPRWKKFTVTHTQLQAAALVNGITLFTLPGGGVIHAVKIKASSAFAGTGITNYGVAVGISGTPEKYAANFQVGGVAVSDTNFQLSSTVGGETHAAAGKDILVTATAIGANLDQSSGGSVDIWVLYSVTEAE